VVPQGHAFYDYDSKYVKGGSKHVIPAQISPNIYQKIQTLALKAHQAIGCRGVSRSDFRYDDRFSEDWRACLAGSQHPARHDADLPGARNGRPCRPFVW
jgi:D-alanine-D-alanine ligase-like ATP-grasp enzyme